jgi:hypothetical protein
VLKPFAMLFFIVVMVWVGAILVTSNASKRIERACFPVGLMDRVVVATVQLLHEPWAADAHHYMKSIEYGCQFTVWKTFYEDLRGERPVPGGSSQTEETPSVSESKSIKSPAIKPTSDVLATQSKDRAKESSAQSTQPSTIPQAKEDISTVAPTTPAHANTQPAKGSYFEAGK